MKGSVKSDDVLALGVIAGQFESALDRLRAGVAVINPVWTGHGSDTGESLGQRHHILVVKISARHVDQFASLFLNGRDDMRMAMAGRNDSDAGRKIKELVSVNVGDNDTAAALGDHWVRAGIRGRNKSVITVKNTLCVRTGQSSLELRCD